MDEEPPIGELIKKYWEEKLKRDKKDEPPRPEINHCLELLMQMFILN